MNSLLHIFLIFLLAIAFGAPIYAHALELTYPPFLPLKDSMGLGEFTAVIFAAALGIGSLLAVGVIIWAGWQFSTSGDNPSKRADARRRIIETFIGLAMLLLVAVVLRTINPDLLRLSNPTFDTTPTGPLSIGELPSYSVESGTAFQIFPLGEELDKHGDFLTKTNFVLDDLITALKGELELCTKEACEARTRAPYINNICSIQTCNREFSGSSRPIKCEVVGRCNPKDTCCTLPACPPETCLPDDNKNFCELKSGVSDICPGREAAKQDLPQLYTIFTQLQTFFETDIAKARTQIQTCRSTRGSFLYNYSYASRYYPAAKNCSDCKESMDYFCATDGDTATRIHLPLDGLVTLENQFIVLEQKIYDEINLCSCSNSEFTCPSNFATCQEGCGRGTSLPCEGPGCSEQCTAWTAFPPQPKPFNCPSSFFCYATQGVGSCENRVTNPNPRPGGVQGQFNIHPFSGELVNYADPARPYRKSCPPELWEDLEKLHAIRQELEALRGTLAGYMATIDGGGASLVGTSTPAYFLGVCPFTQNRIGAYPWAECTNKGEGCCPTDAMRQDINECRNEDFYACGASGSISSVSPPPVPFPPPPPPPDDGGGGGSDGSDDD